MCTVVSCVGGEVTCLKGGCMVWTFWGTCKTNCVGGPVVSQHLMVSCGRVLTPIFSGSISVRS